jgi:hypothetical protein
MIDANTCREGRLRRKLEQRDRRIAGLLRRIDELQSALITKDFEVKRMPTDVVRAVQQALCNVRMIPVLGLGSGDRIVEVTTTKKEKP